VNILDENIVKDQRHLLRSWRIRIRHIGYDIGRKGIQDEEIIPFLLQLPHPTFFTRDLGFYDRTLCHRHYCLVCMAVEKHEAAFFIRRFLRHSAFDTRAKRLGTVVRISHVGFSVWRLHVAEERFSAWDK
jgi:hypothetical protein